MSRLRPRVEGQKQSHLPGLTVPPAGNKVVPIRGTKTGKVDSAAAEDKLIKRGQLTLPRVLSLAAIAGVVVAAVSLGGVWLIIGYWVITLGFCLFLALIAFDYGVEMEKVYPEHQKLEMDKTEAADAHSDMESPSEPTDTHVSTAQRAQRRVKRQAKRRRY